ncbi:MAG: hypothetical protein ACQERG_01590, partial [Pseudomonadota bacterium]
EPTEPGRGVILIQPGPDRSETRDWQGLREALSAEGYGVLLLQPAGGQCEGPWRRLHRDGMAETGAWFDWLLSEGHGRIHFLGVERGANQVAWFLASSRHPALGAALLLDPMVWRASDAADRYQQRHGRPLEPVLDRARDLQAEGEADTLLRDIGFLHCDQVDVSAAALLSYYADEPKLDTGRLLGDLPGRGLVVAGPGYSEAEHMEAAASEAGITFRRLTDDLPTGASGPVTDFLRGEDETSE